MNRKEAKDIYGRIIDESMYELVEKDNYLSLTFYDIYHIVEFFEQSEFVGGDDEELIASNLNVINEMNKVTKSSILENAPFAEHKGIIYHMILFFDEEDILKVINIMKIDSIEIFSEKTKAAIRNMPTLPFVTEGGNEYVH